MEESRPKVFISYSHDSDVHKKRVLALSDQLRNEGVDCWIDQYELFPKEGWPLWMERQIEQADFVLIAFTDNYRRKLENPESPNEGLGVCWEIQIVYNKLFRSRQNNQKFVPILFPGIEPSVIPDSISGYSHFKIDADYENIYRLITKQPKTSANPLGEIKKLPAVSRLVPAMRPFNVPFRRNVYFTGRKDILKNIKNSLESDNEAALTQAIFGLGGIGKTQIAVEYAYQRRDFYEAVLWVDSETNSSLAKSVVEIAKKLNLPEKDSQEQVAVFKAVQNWLATYSNWLLILDNVEDFDLYENFIPPNIRGHVLITTRQKTRKQIAKIQIDEMEEEGTLLLLRRSGLLGLNDVAEKTSQETKTTADKINAIFDGLPVALEMAGAYIEETGTTLEKYLKLFESRGNLFLTETVEGGGYRKSVAEAFKLSLEKTIELNPTAGELIQLCAFLDPDFIPEIIFKSGKKHLSESLSKILGDDHEWNQTVAQACQYSLLQRNEDGQSLSMHRLVQQVIRDNLNNQKKWAETSINTLNATFPSPGDFDNWPLCRDLLPNVQTVFSWVKKYDLKTEETGRLCNDAGLYLDKTGEYEAVETFYKRTLLALKNSFGEEHPDIATSLNNLAALYYNQGRYEEAEPLCKDALEISKKLLGEEHPSVATSLNNLAELFRSQGRYEEAEPLYKDTLKMQKKILGEEHPDIANTLNNLGTLYSNKEDYIQSEEYLTKALELIVRLLGSEHPSSKLYKNNLEWVRKQMK